MEQVLKVYKVFKLKIIPPTLFKHERHSQELFDSFPNVSYINYNIIEKLWLGLEVDLKDLDNFADTHWYIISKFLGSQCLIYLERNDK